MNQEYRFNVPERTDYKTEINTRGKRPEFVSILFPSGSQGHLIVSIETLSVAESRTIAKAVSGDNVIKQYEIKKETAIPLGAIVITLDNQDMTFSHEVSITFVYPEDQGKRGRAE